VAEDILHGTLNTQGPRCLPGLRVG
jgi:hypothetical protein